MRHSREEDRGRLDGLVRSRRRGATWFLAFGLVAAIIIGAWAWVASLRPMEPETEGIAESVEEMSSSPLAGPALAPGGTEATESRISQNRAEVPLPAPHMKRIRLNPGRTK